ncbi:ciliogenesis-associated TTC17-interacting protein isoform X2 [Channa argus]|uniref:ciliogenesis-associated TTC17-interacting protein isoform X2 n=1 Tax=Channa argus TaxID=215402 RepID=UPI0035200DAA
MEIQLHDESPAWTEGLEPREELKASDVALTFMSNIEPAELQKCVFPDSLVTLSECGTDLGTFRVTVEFARRDQQPCLLLQAQSHGAIDESPCGTTVTGQEKQWFPTQEVTKKSVSYPMSVLRGLVTEGSNLLLMRLIALGKAMPENMTFITFDEGLHIVHTTFSELGLNLLEVGCKTMEVFGVERIVHSVEGKPTTWQCYFLNDGHLASRVQVGSPITMRCLQLPSQQEIGFEKIPHLWEEDMEMRSKFLDRKEELKADHASYLRQHPEIRALISDFLQFLLLRKPQDVFQFTREYFLPFASRQTYELSLKDR